MKPLLSREDIERRAYAIPEPIKRIGENNPVVHDVLNRYFCGQIVTWEECLCQCVLALSQNYSELTSDYFKWRQITGTPVMVPSGHKEGQG